MPVFEIEKDGKVYEVDAPSAEAAVSAFGQPQEFPQPNIPINLGGPPGMPFMNPSMIQGFGERIAQEAKPSTVLKGVGEAALHYGTAGIAAPVAGLAGLLTVPSTDADTYSSEASRDIENVMSAMTYQPRTGAGKALTAVVDAPMEAYGKAADRAGQVAVDATGSPGVGAALNTTINFLPSLLFRGRKAPDPVKGQESAAYLAQQRGLRLPPTEARPTMINNFMEGFAGKIKTRQLASEKNQPVLNDLAKMDGDLRKFGLSDDLSAEALADVRKKAGDAYEALGSLGRIKPDATYFKNLIEIGKEYSKAQKDFGNAAPSPVLDWVKKIGKAREFDADSAVEMTKILREEGDKAMRAGDKRLAAGLRAVSKNFEEALDRAAIASGKNNVITDFQEARRAIAKTYTIEKALTNAGNIDAVKLAKELKSGKLSGPLEEIAQFGDTFGKSVQVPEKYGSVTAYSPLDAAASAISGNKEGLIAMASRAPVRSLITSKAYQRTAGRALSAEEKVAQAKANNRRKRTLAQFGILDASTAPIIYENTGG